MFVFLWLVAGGVWAQATPGFVIQSNVPDVLTPGEAGSIEVFVKANDPERSLSEAVVFLNVVEHDEAKRYPQASYRLFSSAEEETKTLQRVLSGDALREGVSIRLNYQLRDNVKPATYSVVIQVFNGTNVNPNRVSVKQRLAMKAFKFVIEP